MTTLAPYLILFTPLVAAAVILFAGRFSKPFSAGLAIAAAAFTCILSWYVFMQPEPEEPVRIYWINLPPLTVPIGFAIDWLSKLMLVVVTTIATLVFTYSLGYMRGEEGYSRYFAGLSLFLFSMLGIVLADNLVMMFIFWELVGVSSYILIGHYYGRNSAAEACKQAFLVNRIGDFGFMLGIIMLWYVTGKVMFGELEDALGELAGGEVYLTITFILIFCGTIGKSAQLPLHVWLPNSMEGPTPVSSLLHAATMVAAGVYMLARIFPILATSPEAMMVIAWVGGITCFVAGLMALQQDDIKRILAYSTISQLGYMVLGVGVAPAAEVPMFHLFTHACFKCLLFLCAGSVIVALHHEQNIWKMGALKNKMPATFVCMGIGGLALSGFPGFSGFFSKDNIILWAYATDPILFWISSAAVALTGFYMFRLFMVVFFGPPRDEHAKHASESPKVMIIPMILLAIPAFIGGYGFVTHFLFPDIPHPEGLPHWPEYVTLGFLAVGLFSAIAIYRNPQKDPIRIPFFANRLYIDQLYQWIVRTVQDGTGAVLGWFDRWVIDGLFVRLIGGKGSQFAGYVMNLLQIGNLQAYAFFFGAGVVVLLYFLLK